MEMAHDARAVANFLLDLAEQRKTALTHMSIHKITYYAQGWHLLAFGGPLIEQEFEAWQYGPVVRLVWDSLKQAGSQPIAGRATAFDPVTRTHGLVESVFSEIQAKFLRDVFLAYAGLSATELSRMTHKPGGAWDRIWNAPRGRVVLGMKISNEMIKEDFSRERLPERRLMN